MAGGWGVGLSLAVTVRAHVCVCHGVGLLTVCSFAWVLAWPWLRSCGSRCGGVCWAMFVSPGLRDFSGACDPECQ